MCTRMYAPRGAGQNVPPSFIFKTSPVCVNEVKYLKQVLYVCLELYKCSKKTHIFARCCVYLGTTWIFPHLVVAI